MGGHGGLNILPQKSWNGGGLCPCHPPPSISAASPQTIPTLLLYDTSSIYSAPLLYTLPYPHGYLL